MFQYKVQKKVDLFINTESNHSINMNYSTNFFLILPGNLVISFFRTYNHAYTKKPCHHSFSLNYQFYMLKDIFIFRFLLTIRCYCWLYNLTWCFLFVLLTQDRKSGHGCMNWWAGGGGCVGSHTFAFWRRSGRIADIDRLCLLSRFLSSGLHFGWVSLYIINMGFVFGSTTIVHQ